MLWSITGISTVISFCSLWKAAVEVIVRLLIKLVGVMILKEASSIFLVSTSTLITVALLKWPRLMHVPVDVSPFKDEVLHPAHFMSKFEPSQMIQCWYRNVVSEFFSTIFSTSEHRFVFTMTHSFLLLSKDGCCGMIGWYLGDGVKSTLILKVWSCSCIFLFNASDSCSIMYLAKYGIGPAADIPNVILIWLGRRIDWLWPPKNCFMEFNKI
jgi:hypothetical protein